MGTLRLVEICTKLLWVALSCMRCVELRWAVYCDDVALILKRGTANLYGFEWDMKPHKKIWMTTMFSTFTFFFTKIMFLASNEISIPYTRKWFDIRGAVCLRLFSIFFNNFLNKIMLMCKTRYQTPLRGKLFMIRGALCLQICLRSWGSFPGTEKT